MLNNKRSQQIVSAAKKLGLKKLSRNAVAKSCKISPSLVTYYFSLKELKKIVKK